jgi:serine phosphatase RsbU (regulator of sigma subunit)
MDPESERQPFVEPAFGVRDSAWLDVVDRDRPQRRLALTGNRLRIGSAADAELRVDGAVAAPLHAELLLQKGGWLVRDLGSKAGTRVNGARVTERRLAPGDVIELGARSPWKATFAAGANAPVFAAPAASELATLARFFAWSSKLSGTFSLDDVLCDVVDMAVELTGADRGALAQLQPDGAIALRSARKAGRQGLGAAEMRISSTLVQRAVQGRSPLVLPDFNEEVDLSRSTSILDLRLRSAVLLPLARFAASDNPSSSPPAACSPQPAEVFGVLYLDSTRNRKRLAEFDLHLLERLAFDASSAIENARLLQEAEARRRIEQQMRMARDVQAALMPREFASTAAFEVAGHCEPCLDLGGDYVDQFDLGSGRTAVVVADVCGKGVDASLLAAALQGALVAEMSGDRPLGEIVARVNRVHCRLSPAGRFVTMVLAVLEPDGTVRLVNAGHVAPLLVGGGGVRPCAESSIALGLDETAGYREETVRLAAGESLVLCSDGVLECEDPQLALYGRERLQTLLAQHANATPRECLDALLRDLRSFRGDAPVSDDTSVIAIRRRPG